jgi:GTP cyclohydrolase II
MSDPVFDPSASLNPGPLAGVERAVAELRRGMALVILDGQKPARLVAGAEIVGQDRLDAMRAATGESELLLTPERAATLKIRLYSEGAIALTLGEAAGAVPARTEFIRMLIDPARDLNSPLKGPFTARRLAMDDTGRAAIRLAKLAGLLPAVVNGTLSFDHTRDENIRSFALRHELCLVQADDILAYERRAAENLTRVAEARLPLSHAAEARLILFREGFSGREHAAVIVGALNLDMPILVRLHSECFTGDLLDSLRCDCGPQLRGALAAMNSAGAGILLYLAQEGRAIGLANKLRAYHLQDEGFDTFEANRRVGFEDDERSFDVAAAMLAALGVRKIRLMTNNPEKLTQLAALGIEITEQVPLKIEAGAHNRAYLDAKRKSGHLL